MRRALALSINREAISTAVLQGSRGPAYHYTPPGAGGFRGFCFSFDGTGLTFAPRKRSPDSGPVMLRPMEPSGRHALVTNRHADLVSVIDLETHTQVKTIPVGRAPHGMALQPR